MTNREAPLGSAKFPVSGEDYLDALGRVVVTESKVADVALLDALQDSISKIFDGWFPQTKKPDLRPLLKRLTNSLSATGSVPEANTLKTLEEIEGWQEANIQLDAKKAGELLRAETRDFRQARTFLFHQSKCINGVINFMDVNDEAISAAQKKLVRSLLDYQLADLTDTVQWATKIGELFIDIRGGDKNQKNAKMYVGLWEKFVQLIAINADRKDFCYADYLAERVKDYLDKSTRSVFEEFVVNQMEDMKLLTRSANSPKLSITPDLVTKEGIPVEIKVASGVVSLVFATFNLDKSQLERVVSELVFHFATDPTFSKLGIGVGVTSSNPPALTITIENLSSPKDLESVKDYVSRKLA